MKIETKIIITPNLNYFLIIFLLKLEKKAINYIEKSSKNNQCL